MQYTILLDITQDRKKFEAQESARFIYTVLESLQVPHNWNPDEELTVEKKQQLRKLFEDYSITVLDDTDGGVKFFSQGELIAEWYKCTYKIKEDRVKIDRNKRLYLEANVHFWAHFEEQEGNAAITNHTP